MLAALFEVRMGGRTVLPRTDLAVGPREVVAVLGASGSGKTTFLTCLAGLMMPTSGRIVVAGKDLRTLTGAQRARLRRQLIGFVHQQADLIPALTPLQNVMLPALLAGVKVEQARREAEQLIADLGVDQVADTATVSGGEAQRLALARALVTSPALVIADEPTGSLDQETRNDVLALMWGMMRNRGLSAVIATHEPAVADGADRVIHIGNSVA